MCKELIGVLTDSPLQFAKVAVDEADLLAASRNKTLLHQEVDILDVVFLWGDGVFRQEAGCS